MTVFVLCVLTSASAYAAAYYQAPTLAAVACLFLFGAVVEAWRHG